MDRSSCRGVSWRAALAVPALALCGFAAAIPAWAQDSTTSTGGVTRAAVKAELAELVAAGYNPRDWFHYPENLQAAQRVVEQRRAAALAQAHTAPRGIQEPSDMAPPARDSVGGTPEVRSEAGAGMRSRTRMQDERGVPCSYGPACSIYFGH